MEPEIGLYTLGSNTGRKRDIISQTPEPEAPNLYSLKYLDTQKAKPGRLKGDASIHPHWPGRRPGQYDYQT